MQGTVHQDDCRIRRAVWPRDAVAVRRVREAVFVREQGVPRALEWDAKDERAVHLLAEDAALQAIATARLLADGQIGRMAVLAPWRGRGIGSALLRALLEIAHEERYPPLWLNAQNSATAFYRRHGFLAQGGAFEEAGITHRRMILARHKEK